MSLPTASSAPHGVTVPGVERPSSQPSTSGTPGIARRPRSKRDRPCDYCRRLKHSCRILVRGEPCVNCKRTQRACTFDVPPRSTRGRQTSSPQLHSWPPQPLHVPAPLPPHPLQLAGAEPDVSGVPLSDLFAEPPPVSAPRPAPVVTNDAICDLFRDEILSYREAIQADDDNEVNYTSLDLEVNDDEESHYLGSGAFIHLNLDRPSPAGQVSASPSADGSKMVYRQVADPKNPVFFCRNPSRVYGLSNAAFAAEQAWESVTNILRAEGQDMSTSLLQKFLNKTLPALPMIDKSRLESACYTRGPENPFPHTILVGVIIHSAVYLPSLRHLCKNLWGIALNLLDNEYRQPRLQTLQLALLDIYGRPVYNPGGNHMAISRALGAAQVLGLHRNSERWKLPKWERSTRKNIWWLLYVADKWTAIQYGRPSNIPTERDIPLPSLHDGGRAGMGDTKVDIGSFVAMCRLTVIVDRLLPLLMEQEPLPTRYSDHQRILLNASRDLSDLKMATQSSHSPGHYSFRLCLHGTEVLLCRLAFSRMQYLTVQSLDRVPQQVLSTVSELLTFLEALDAVAFASYWAPWSAFHISHAASLLLRTAVWATESRPNMVSAVLDVLDRMISIVLRAVDGSWEIAEESLGRIKVLVRSVEGVQGIQQLQARLAPPPRINVPINGPADASNAIEGYPMPSFQVQAPNPDAPNLDFDLSAWLDLGWQGDWIHSAA